MELDFRKLFVTKLFDFSKEEEKLIFEIYDRLSELYGISIVDIQDSPYNQFKPNDIDLLKEPKLCYCVTNKSNTSTFYLLFVNIVGTSIRGARTTDTYDTLEIWGLKELNEDFGFISINRKNFADNIAGFFSSFNINFKENRDFGEFYVLGSDPYKTMAFLNSKRKETIKSVPDEGFKLEIKNNILGFGFPKVISIDNALMVSDFLAEI